MTTQYYLGNVEFSRALDGTKLLNAALQIVSGGLNRTLFTFSDGNFKVSPTQWIPEEYDYKLVSLTGKTIERVTGWRPYWVVKMSFSGRSLWRGFVRSFGVAGQTKWTFGERGASSDRIFYFLPNGDLSRPKIQVVIEFDEIKSEHFGDKMIGYSGSEMMLKGVKLYDMPVFPEPSLIADKVPFGIRLTDTAVRVDPKTT